jgi:polysaccharide deacetylase 2 family uncharacterized protein YibQ
VRQRNAPLKIRKRTVFVLLLTIAVCLAVIVLLLPPKSTLQDSRDGKAEREIRSAPAADRTTPGGRLKAPTALRRPEQKEALQAEKKPRPPDVRVRVSVVLDDAGYNLTDLEAVLGFPGELTVSVLPHLPYSAEAARRVREAGKEVILHLPMEPQGNADPGPGAITTAHDRDEIWRRLESAFASVPEAAGMNNHMGSKAMEDTRVVASVMEYLREHNKFFLDSKTTPRTVAKELAESFGVLLLERSIFLDNVVAEDSIEEQFLRGLDVARNQGSAILVGHVRNPEVMMVLNKMYPLLSEQGVEMRALSTLIESEKAD